MKRIFILFILVAIKSTPAVAGATSNHRADIDFRIVEPPVFTDGPAGVCQFQGRVPIVNEDRKRLGRSELCVESFESVGDLFIEHGYETLTFSSGGTLVVDIEFVDTFKTLDFATHLATGTVRSGTGPYAGATGSLTGHGTITYDSFGVPHPRLSYEIELHK